MYWQMSWLNPPKGHGFSGNTKLSYSGLQVLNSFIMYESIIRNGCYDFTR